MTYPGKGDLTKDVDWTSNQGKISRHKEPYRSEILLILPYVFDLSSGQSQISWIQTTKYLVTNSECWLETTSVRGSTREFYCQIDTPWSYRLRTIAESKLASNNGTFFMLFSKAFADLQAISRRHTTQLQTYNSRPWNSVAMFEGKVSINVWPFTQTGSTYY